MLRVISEAKSHAAADRWYEQHGIARPRNIMVPGNPPLALEATEGGYRENGKIVLPTSPADAPRVLAHWDNLYQQRRYKVGDVRICEPLVVNIQCGYPFPERFVNEVFGNSGFPDTEWHPVEVSRDIMRAVLTAVGRSDVADVL
ncbi:MULTISPECIES: hypothetical protein [Sorangium]|uniref:hypothetical protein n=1 Tax=Sorangium TaxID=39643 RepID=UPI003D9C1843